MFFKIIKSFALAIFLISMPINGMQKNQGMINQLLKVSYENKGKILLASGAIATVWFGYQHRSLIEDCLKSYFNPPISNLHPSIYQSLDDQSGHSEYKLTEQEHITFQKGRNKITIDNSSGGGIKIYTHDSTDIVLSSIKRSLNPDDKIGTRVSFIDEEEVEVKAKYSATALIHYILRLPEKYELNELIVKTDKGSIILNDFKSKMSKAETKDGLITTANVINLHGKTTNGYITAKNIKDGILETTHGWINAEDIAAYFKASSKKGSIEVKSISITNPPIFSCSVSEVIKFTAKELNAKVHLKTRNGAIISDDFKLNNKKGSNRELNAEIGNIDADNPNELNISADGNIQLIKK